MASVLLRIFRVLPFTAAAFLGTIGQAGARPLDEVTASKILRVVVYRDNAPFSWMDGDKPIGIDVEIGHAIARHIGVEAEIVPRMTAEEVDDDLRFNIWKGPYTEGGVGDVMLHVPIDKELIIRNNLAVIGNAYFQERVALAYDPKRITAPQSFDVFRDHQVGVLYSTVEDYFLMRFADGALINNVVHSTRLSVGIGQFANGEVPAFLGVRSDLEGILHTLGKKAEYATPPMPGIVRSNWVIGTAVKDNSRDLGYAIGAALRDLRETGELERIFAKFGVTYTPPPTR